MAGPAGEGRFDDVVGRGFVVIAKEADPRSVLDDDQLEFLERLGARFVTLDPHVRDGVRDLDGRLTRWLDDHDAAVVIVRPDYYVFGAVGSTGDLPALVDDFRQQLTTSQEVTHA